MRPDGARAHRDAAHNECAPGSLHRTLRMDPTIASSLLTLDAQDAGPEAQERMRHELVAALRRDVERVVHGALARHAGTLARAHVSAEDASQDVLEKLLRGRLPTQVGVRPDHLLEAWIRTMTLNWFRDVARRPVHRLRAHPLDADPEGEEAPPPFGLAPVEPDPLERRDLRTAVDGCAERLSSQRRRLFEVLVRDPDASVPELAQALGYPSVEGGADIKVRDAIYTLRAAMRRDMAACLEAHEYPTTQIRASRASEEK